MKRLKDLVLMGAPGSGKGSQSKLLANLGYIQISTGDLLREEIASGSDFGKVIASIINNGNLISDDLALSLIKTKVNDSQSFIFDGFPRTVNQAKMLDREILLNRHSQVVFFEVDDKILLDRIVNRRTCEKCGSIFNLKLNPPKSENTCDGCGYFGLFHRKDDNASVLQTRLKVYYDSTNPVVDYYTKMNRVIRLNADTSTQELFTELQKIISD